MRVAAAEIVVGRLEGVDQAAAVVAVTHRLEIAHETDAFGDRVEADDGNAVFGVGELDEQPRRCSAALAGRRLVRAGRSAGRKEGRLALGPGPTGRHAAGVVEDDDDIDRLGHVIALQRGRRDLAVAT